MEQSNTNLAKVASIADCNNITFRLATDSDLARAEARGGTLPLLSFSSITSYHTCPTYGCATKSYGRTPSEQKRRTALDAGKVSHDVFAAARLYQLIDAGMIGHAQHHAQRILGESRSESCWDQLKTKTSDPMMRRYNFCIEALYTSGYTDDPYDKYRTFANIEETLMAYITSYDYARYPVLVLDHNDPHSFVGIETPVVLYCAFEIDSDIVECLVVGILDGMHYDIRDLNRFIVNENKTASRINEAWLESFRVDHQISMYALMASLVLHKEITDVHVYGSPIPLGRGRTQKQPLKRHMSDYLSELTQWILTALTYHETFKTRPMEAPRYTHACRRYNSMCSMIPVCAVPRDERMTELQDCNEVDNTHHIELLNSYDNMKETFIGIGKGEERIL